MLVVDDVASSKCCQALVDGLYLRNGPNPAHEPLLGRVVQVDPIEPKLKPPGTKRLKLKCELLLSSSAFKFNWCRCSLERTSTTGLTVTAW
jgi:hypothetical protein